MTTEDQTNAQAVDQMARKLADRAVQARRETTWKARAPKYGPDDVRLMMAHPTGSSPQNADNHRMITLDAEVAESGDNLFRLEMTPAQFADLVASRATVVHSVTPIATPRETVTADPLGEDIAALRDAVARERAAGDGSYASQICDLVDALYPVVS